jgi:tRNA dimethylallyltransferase
MGYLRGEASLMDISNEIALQTRRYAKRQLTWFRKESQTIWVDSCQESGRVSELIEDLIQPQEKEGEDNAEIPI